MKINKDQAKLLCEEIIKRLSNWPAWNASLQSGRGERNKAAIIEQAIAHWLTLGKVNKKLLVLMEHRNSDYSLIDPESIGQARLKVETVIEYKFNYSGQLNEISKRIKGLDLSGKPHISAIEQVNDYKLKLGCNNGYVLYLIAKSPTPLSISARDRDAGFSYASDDIKGFGDAITYLENEMSKQASSIIGSHKSDDGDAYCCLIYANNSAAPAVT